VLGLVNGRTNPNSRRTWDAYDNRYWPARYLIDADGFIRYQHFGEGAYEENEEEVQELLAERNEILATHP
jgi:hypothetical protein